MPVDASALRMFSGAANISAGGETSILIKLLKLGRTDVLDAFRSYVYYGNVSGSPDAGLSVSANTAVRSGQNNKVTYSGTAGGFGGSLLNGSVKNSSVTGLNNVTGLNSTGGFVGYSGKSGVVSVDKLDVLGNNSGALLGGALGVLDTFGSHIDDSIVTGVNGGYTVQSKRRRGAASPEDLSAMQILQECLDDTAGNINSQAKWSETRYHLAAQPEALQEGQALPTLQM